MTILLHDYYNIHFVAPVVIQLEVLSATTVNVSWDRLDIPEITGYIVYYSQTMNSEMVPIQHFINVFSSTNFVLLTDLTSDIEYQFDVVAVAELDGDTVMGSRSDNFTERLTPTSLPTIATQSNIYPNHWRRHGVYRGSVFCCCCRGDIIIFRPFKVRFAFAQPQLSFFLVDMHTQLLSVYRFQRTHVLHTYKSNLNIASNRYRINHTFSCCCRKKKVLCYQRKNNTK